MILAAAASSADDGMPWWSWVLFVPVFLALLLVCVRHAARNVMDWHERHTDQWPYRRP